jgi:anti-sigma B factor antagonist
MAVAAGATVLSQTCRGRKFEAERKTMTDDKSQDSDGLESADTAAAEDLAPQYALTEDGALKIYSVGETTVLGFDGKDVPGEFNAAHYRAVITDLLRANQSHTVAFDLTGVRLVPSGMLGLWVSLSRVPDLPLKVQVFNPSDDVKEVLSITKLKNIFEICEVDVESS